MGHPSFDFKTAEKILTDSAAEHEFTGLKSFSYDPETDTFLVVGDLHGKDETEEFIGFSISTPEGEVKVYPIGAYAWTWEEFVEQKLITYQELREKLDKVFKPEDVVHFQNGSDSSFLNFLTINTAPHPIPSEGVAGGDKIVVLDRLS
jgi:hypothetical protein